MCINEVADGLQEGLSHFSSTPSRVALAYAVHPDDPPRILDPCQLLRGHEPRLGELFLESDQWREEASAWMKAHFLERSRSESFENPLVGLITCAGGSQSVFFQMWFTEEHPDICSIGPTQRWLEYAAGLLSRNVLAGIHLNIGTSGYVLKEYATHAVRDYIVDQRNLRMGWDTRVRVFPILDAVLEISKTLEEGAWPRGELVFVEPWFLPRLNMPARFPALERPDIQNHKHVRKMLLAVEQSDRRLVSDGARIIGLTRDRPPEASIIVEFRGNYGFLKLDDELVASFSDGRYHATNRRANLVQVEEALLETDLDPADRHDLFQIITRIVQASRAGAHGAAIVVDLAEIPRYIPGQSLMDPLDLRSEPLLDLARSLAKVDGALHLGRDLKLHGFACLLDGHAVPGENRARGARFNSALRYSAEHDEVLIVVVSSDRPVSVIQGGVELTARCEWRPSKGCILNPPTLKEWLSGG
jgi:hypothetical protein